MPAIKQHYVPQFIIRHFSNETGLVCIIDKQSSPVRLITTKASTILFENDMYETKNLDGSYFDRNVIENKFAQIEGYVSNILQAINSNLDNEKMLSSDEKEALALFMALQLVRIPLIREIISDSPKGRFTSDSDKEIYDKAMYRMMLLSRESGFCFLKENGLELSEDAKKQLEGESLLEHVSAFILNECTFYILVAPSNSAFVLSDMPVLIDCFSDAKYIFPVAPNVALCCCLINQASPQEFGVYIKAQKEWVDNINRLLCEKAKRWIICKESGSYTFLKQFD